jgi:hypothetical protein
MFVSLHRWYVEFMWLWRLYSSKFFDLGGGTKNIPMSYVWVFDSISGPDGFLLKDKISLLSVKKDVDIVAYGPEKLMFLAFFKVLIVKFFKRQYELNFLLQEKLENDFKSIDTFTLIQGSSHSLFSSIIRKALNCETWEVQHGMFDQTYNNIKAKIFFTRNSEWRNYLTQRNLEVEILGVDLNPAAGNAVVFSSLDLPVYCFSKNPGGNCNSKELAIFEKSVMKIARKNGVHYTLKLHPRDNFIKLILRHKSIKPIFWCLNLKNCKGNKVLFSSYSSALLTEALPGDFVVNTKLPSQDNELSKYYTTFPINHLDMLSSGDIYGYKLED